MIKRLKNIVIECGRTSVGHEALHYIFSELHQEQISIYTECTIIIRIPYVSVTTNPEVLKDLEILSFKIFNPQHSNCQLDAQYSLKKKCEM